MPRRIRAPRIAQQLAELGHEPSEFEGGDWDPGYRCAQHGPRTVHVFHDGPAEEARLTAYATELRSLGYTVVPDQMDRDGRRRLAVTLP
ncbi:hypothetical protein [Streptomyces sp. NRRL F-5135]|uniref:hypothetical protein n=1 Tax=Streptomyces sp. NRRL F-5135 TaxID=1463858 RepID=UPI0004C5EEF3|nr:hypothetical protein [Streptomyces sp. NRRL F-5135]